MGKCRYTHFLDQGKINEPIHVLVMARHRTETIRLNTHFSVGSTFCK